MRLQGAVSLLWGALRAAGSSTAPKFSNTGAASLVITRGFAEDAGELKKTPLYDFHVEHGGENWFGYLVSTGMGANCLQSPLARDRTTTPPL